MIDLYISTSYEGRYSLDGAPLGASHDDRMRILEGLNTATVVMSQAMFRHVRAVFADIVIPTDNIVITNGDGELAISMRYPNQDILFVACPETIQKGLAVAHRIILNRYTTTLPESEPNVPRISVDNGWLPTDRIILSDFETYVFTKFKEGV